MSKEIFEVFVYSPSVLTSGGLAIAGTRGGGCGIINGEYDKDFDNIKKCLDSIEKPYKGAKGAYGIKLPFASKEVVNIIRKASDNLKWIIVDEEHVIDVLTIFKSNKITNIKLLVECKSGKMPDCVKSKLVDGVIVKGNESGGYVGEESSFILLQKWLKQTDLPLYVRGGLTPHVAAACSALGVVGGVLDSQVLLLDESPVADVLVKIFAPLSGSETIAVGDGEKGEYFRVLNRPNLKVATEFVEKSDGLSIDNISKLVGRYEIDFSSPLTSILPVGHDVCFAESWRKKYSKIVNVIRAIDDAVESYPQKIVINPPLVENSPLAQDLGIKFPIVQGPMTRVSDTPEFANSVAEGGALPMLAFALLRADKITKLLEDTKGLIGSKPWGIGLLGFVPNFLLQEQIEAALPFKPNYAIIAGGRPDQAVKFEEKGIPAFLHLPSASLLENFLKGGARRFIFEGRECGGHIGPLSSFTLWSTMIDRLLVGLDECGVKGEDVYCLFAGGIHDEISSAMLQIMLAPLAEKGVKLGIIMGSAYLFTKEIVNGNAIVDKFQKVVVDCEHTVNLESGPGHASRCAYTPFAKKFFNARKDFKNNSELPVDEIRLKLDEMIMGTLRTASKGVARKGKDSQLVEVSSKEQEKNGMYMLGQLVTLRNSILTIEELHNQVTINANRLIETLYENNNKASSSISNSRGSRKEQKPVDIAIVGMSCALPGAKNIKEYWKNIIEKYEAVGEIPKERWDWRLYFSEDRHEKDKIYSKWGGFIDDMIFDPMKYGITPKSIESVDPMQLMTLEVASAALEDAGFDNSDTKTRMHTSVIMGISGGAADVGMQYGLRSELPRFSGELPKEVASRLPEWTEDTFAGILLNVVAGRISNRLNLGGVNYSTDAACGSSLSAIYQGAIELRNGNSDVVIAGGTDTAQSPFGFMCFSKTQALSPTGRCRTFDKSADGIVISEGIAMVVLKRLEDAERDGDKIYSVIKGVGGGSDGKAKGLSAPLPAGQLRAMRRAYEQAGFNADSVRLFEAHGTGTVAGDTAELESTTTLMNENGGKPRQAVVGSVKTMIGHTKATAGVAGLIKAALSIHHKVLPPHLGVKNVNDVLADENSSLYVLDEAQPWIENSDVPRRAATSAFGFGGTNFHVIMEEYRGEYRDNKKSSTKAEWASELFICSGSHKNDLINQLNELQEIVQHKPDVYLRDLAFAFVKKYDGEGEIVSIVAESFEDLQGKIIQASNYLSGNYDKLSDGICYSGDSAKGKIAVLFPGQGSQYTNMIREVSVNFPIVAETLSEANKCLLEPFASRFGEGVNLDSFIFPRGVYNEEGKKKAEEALKSTDVAQPALGAVEAGLWKLMESYGLVADAFAGHSYGEFVALYAAGKIKFDDLMMLSEARGRLIVDKAKESGLQLGTMAAVKASKLDVQQVIENIKDVAIANHNSPTQVIISGSEEGVEKASQALKESGNNVVMLSVSAAFHSPFVEPARESLSKVINKITWRKGSESVVYSNNTAKIHEDNIDLLKHNMAEHLTKPVEFVDEIEQMYEDGVRTFIELGPKSVLAKLVGSILKGKNYNSIAFDNNGGGVTGMLNAFGHMVCAGAKLNVLKLFEGRECIESNFNKIAEQERNPKPAKHVWLLNGASARRASQPMQQIGLTLEQYEEQKSKKTVNTKVVSNQQAKSVNNNVSMNSAKVIEARKNNTFNSNHKSMEKNFMRNRGSNIGDPRNDTGDSVTRAYFELVSQQLNNARDVALAELGVNFADIENNNISQTQRASITSARAGSSMPPLNREQSPARPRNTAQIVPLAKTSPQASHAVNKSTHNNVKAAPAKAPITNAQVADVEQEFGENALKDIMLAIVAEKTGYEADMISFDQNLEADLGVDSIKRIDIVGGIIEKLPNDFIKNLDDKIRTDLSTSTTLEQMLSLILKVGSNNSKAPANSNTPAQAATSNILNEEKIKEIILNVVTEKTGYEADMISFDQNLEAELGVDSIKRIDIVGGVVEQLPDSYKNTIGDEGRSKLSTSTTLDQILNLLLEAGENSVNFNLAEAGKSKAANVVASNVASDSPRLKKSRAVIVPASEEVPQNAIRKLNAGNFLITEDSLNVANELAIKIGEKGGKVYFVPAKAISNEQELIKWLDSDGAKIDSLDGIIHLTPLGLSQLKNESSVREWKSQIFASEKSLFLLINKFNSKINDDAHILAASSLGGNFGRDNTKKGGISLQGGSVGMVKSLCKERQGVRGKTVDFDTLEEAADIASNILDELELVGGRHEVGYPSGKRTIFKTQITQMDNPSDRIEETGLVTLATGGARGVTAEVLREIANSGNTLILTGRSPLPTTEQTLRNDTVLASLETEKELARHFVKSESLPLGDARKKANSVLASREIVDNIADFERSGAKVEYYAVDVTNESAMERMFDDIYAKHGKISGIVHGAGIIEDKFIADISSESWQRVVNTKVIGMLLLQKFVKADSLKFFFVFSSVAGRYGNSGQSNYSTANELMNRICSQLKNNWENKVKVCAFCWGPWGKTKFGTGMVTEATEAKFRKYGVHLVTAELGRVLFRHQIADCEANSNPEVVCGEAMWEEYEARIGEIKTDGSDKKVELLNSKDITVSPNGGLLLKINLDRYQPYLQDHIIEVEPVMPMAIAIELMSQAVLEGFGKDWKVAEVRDVQLFKGVVVDKDNYPLTIKMEMTSHGMDGYTTVKAMIVSASDKPMPHYSATLVLAADLSGPEVSVPEVKWKDRRNCTAQEMYDYWVFHGDSFQVVKSIDILTKQGAKCKVVSTNQNDLLATGTDAGWIIDPAVVDAAAHFSCLWTSLIIKLYCLPVRFKRIIRYVDRLPKDLTMYFIVESVSNDLITVNAYFEDQDGALVMMIEGMQHVISRTIPLGNNKNIKKNIA